MTNYKITLKLAEDCTYIRSVCQIGPEWVWETSDEDVFKALLERLEALPCKHFSFQGKTQEVSDWKHLKTPEDMKYHNLRQLGHFGRVTQ